MAIDIKIRVTWCLGETSSCDIDGCYSFRIADIYFIRGDTNVQSIFLVELVDGACFIPNICVVVEP